MPAFTNTEEFIAECAERRVDYDKLFEPRRTPDWLLRFEAQVLEECRAELEGVATRLQDPNWVRIFEARLQIMNKEREA